MVLNPHGASWIGEGKRKEQAGRQGREWIFLTSREIATEAIRFISGVMISTVPPALVGWLVENRQ